MTVNIIGPARVPADTTIVSSPASSSTTDQKMGRRQLAEALTAAGFPISPKTLENMAWRGDGPPYEKFGRRAVYRWSSALAWANGRLR